MNDRKIAGSLFNRLKYFSCFLIVLWTGCAGASLLWNLHVQHEKVLNIARNSAQISFENDLLYRIWAARQGGVYVPVSEHTPPNPYLKVSDRDILTPSGLTLTLVNPAYMTRQVNQMGVNVRGSRGHITSLKPIRPENAPDPWETYALKEFETGTKEVSSVEMISGEENMRLMRPILTEKACLKCHAAQGYKEGDIRGGISVAIPMAPLRAIEKPHIMGISLAHGVLWLIGITGVMIAKSGLGRQVRARTRAEAGLRRLNQTLERRVNERTEELQKSQGRLQQLASQLILAQERERKRIAVELHDSLLSELAGVKYLLEAKLHPLKKGEPPEAKDFDRIMEIMQKVIQEVRVIMNNLRPSSLDELGLIPTIEWFSKEFQKTYGYIRIQEELNVVEKEIPGTLRAVIFRVLQEALNNFAKHGQGDSAKVSLIRSGNTLRLEVRDNGRGFDVNKVRKGVGLDSMQERVEFSGGSFEIESAEGKGTAIRASWILPEGSRPPENA